MSEKWRRAWPAYVRRHAGDDSIKEIADRIHVHQATVRRWFPEATDQSRPNGDQVVAFARKYDRPRHEALIAADYLRPDDVDENAVVQLGESLGDLGRDELLAEIRLRIPDAGPRSSAVQVDNRRVGDTLSRIAKRPGRGDGLQERDERA